MSWHVYRLPPIDAGWGHLESVKETLAAIADEIDEFSAPDNFNAMEVSDFLCAWKAVKEEVGKRGWDGEFRLEPRVFWLPSEGELAYGFVFKQENDGTTFVVSPYSLPWLDEQVI
ncbi:MAG: hypothetical protein QM769_11040 [Pseudoxanthomonas sp.]